MVRRYLIVANRTLGGQQLLTRVRELLEAGPAHFQVLVPVLGDEEDLREALEQGHRRLEGELDRLREAGADADGEVVQGDPLSAVRAVLAGRRFDEVIVCTLPPGISRWLGLDLVSQVRRSTDLPVTHIVAPAGMPARISSTAVRLTIYLGESDQFGRGPAYSEIVRRARTAGLAGATVLRGIEGFGASSVIHTTRLLTMSEDLPVVITIVDTSDRIEAFLPQLDDLITEGLVVREDIAIVKYIGRSSAFT